MTINLKLVTPTKRPILVICQDKSGVVYNVTTNDPERFQGVEVYNLDFDTDQIPGAAIRVPINPGVSGPVKQMALFTPLVISPERELDLERFAAIAEKAKYVIADAVKAKAAQPPDDAVDAKTAEEPSDEQLVEFAENEYCNDEVSIDADAKTSRGEWGAWVQAWVYVRYSEIAGFEHLEDRELDQEPAP
jgi:hypothetical protein